MHPRFSVPRFACPKSLSESTNRLADKLRPATKYLAQRPKKLAIGAAIATAGVAGLTTALAPVGSAPVVGAIGTPGAINYSGAVHTATHKPSRIHLASDRGTHQQAKGQHQAAEHQAAPETKHAVRQHAASHHSAPSHAVSHRHSAAPAKPYLIYDSTTPSAIPAHRNAAVYATGNYAASPSDVTGRNKVLWIDTTGGDQHASVLDVEPGDASPAAAADWAKNRLASDPHTFRNEWPAVQTAVHALPQEMQSRIRWWIADPTGVPHIVPGAAATQWYWGSSYDITTASPRF